MISLQVLFFLNVFISKSMASFRFFFSINASNIKEGLVVVFRIVIKVLWIDENFSKDR